MMISDADLATVRAILARHVPGVEVRAFGSRVAGRVWRGSDLDLVIMAEHRLPVEVLAHLREDLVESDLPIRVDVSEWLDLPDWLRKEIDERHEVIQEGT